MGKTKEYKKEQIKEAIDWVAEYNGSFKFAIEMQKRVSEYGKNKLTPNQAIAVLKCYNYEKKLNRK